MTKDKEFKKVQDWLDSSLSDTSKLAISEQKWLLEAGEAKHKQGMSARQNIHRALLGSLWILVSMATVLVIVWVWHIVTPTKIHFLQDSQLETISTVLLSIVGSSYLTRYSTNWLNTHTTYP